MRIGGDFKLIDFCNIGCWKSIIIGDRVWLTHRCQIFDTNYHYVANMRTRIMNNHKKAIRIGHDCWIGNSTTIMGGTVLPDGTIIASNSLCNKSYDEIPKFSIIAGVPAKYISTDLHRIDDVNMVIRANRHYRQTDEPYQLSIAEFDFVNKC